VRLTPRFGLAPTPVSAEAGALSQRVSLVAVSSAFSFLGGGGGIRTHVAGQLPLAKGTGLATSLHRQIARKASNHAPSERSVAGLSRFIL
jgi:hypothetical protein